MDRENDYQHDKARHHDFRDHLKTLLDTEAQNRKAKNYRDHHEEGHLLGIAQHPSEHITGRSHFDRIKPACQEFPGI